MRHSSRPTDKNLWDKNGNDMLDLPGRVSDYFYQYGPLHGDGKCGDGSVFANATGQVWQEAVAGGKVGYFGNKVLAVSYGGTLGLSGYKGAMYARSGSGAFILRSELDEARGWFIIRGRSANAPSVARPRNGSDRLCYGTRPDGVAQPCWDNDEIVVTTTDYLPGHSEKLRIQT